MITKEDAIKAIKSVCMFDGETPQMIWSTDAMDAVRGLPDQGGWISVKDRLPEENGDYLVYTREKYIDIFYYDRDCTEWIDDCAVVDGYVTHWATIPEPPEVKHEAD